MNEKNMKPHKHAEVIKAWAENPALEIEYREIGLTKWASIKTVPLWDDSCEYRIKPAKVYPESTMTPSDLPKLGCTQLSFASYGDLEFGSCLQITVRPGEKRVHALTAIANAAIRHAIEAKQVVPIGEYEALQGEMLEVQRSLIAARDAAFTEGIRNADRDMAIARAVESVYCTLVPNKQRNSDSYLTAIIKSVP